jgi:two-component sensor histidine kinase
VQHQKPSTDWNVFVSELRHRLMNDLQMITSVISLQAGRVQEPQVSAALRAAQNRVRAITGVLGVYSTSDLATVHISDYLPLLVSDLIAEYGISNRIEADIRTSDMAVSMEDGIPLALIANELVANALEHAFPDEARGTIRVRLDYAAAAVNGTSESETGELEISDDGIPLESAQFQSGEKTGFTLVRMLTSQLHAKLALENGAAGKTFRLRFPLNAGT